MIAFLGTINPALMKFTPRVEDTFDLYKNLLIGMVVVFQMPTLVFFLAKMRLVTARLLWRHIQYAILVIFIIAAALTPSTDPWNQTVFAAPMIGLYLVSIVIAWLVGPKRESDAPSRRESTKLRLVFAAAVIDQAARQYRQRSADEPPRRWRDLR
jgi:Sec-independent protein secretion pathway component TatC